MELNSVYFPARCVVKMAWISTSVLFMPYSKLYILAELSANNVKVISVDRQKLDLSKYIYSYGTVNSIFVEIQPDSTNIKNDPRTSADAYRICGISYMYMYRAAVHSLDAEFTVLEMTNSNAFFLVSSRCCTISYMLLSHQRILRD